MAERADFVFAREGNVVISHAPGTPGSPPSFGWNALGCPKGTWTLGSSTASVDDGLDNWCTAVNAAIEGASPGGKQITLSGSTELILDDDAYESMDAAEMANTYSWFQIVASNSGNTVTKTWQVGGYFTQLDHNFNGTGPSDVTAAFRASERHVPGTGSGS